MNLFSKVYTNLAILNQEGQEKKRLQTKFMKMLVSRHLYKGANEYLAVNSSDRLGIAKPVWLILSSLVALLKKKALHERLL